MPSTVEPAKILAHRLPKGGISDESSQVFNLQSPGAVDGGLRAGHPLRRRRSQLLRARAVWGVAVGRGRLRSGSVSRASHLDERGRMVRGRSMARAGQVRDQRSAGAGLRHPRRLRERRLLRAQGHPRPRLGAGDHATRRAGETRHRGPCERHGDHGQPRISGGQDHCCNEHDRHADGSQPARGDQHRRSAGDDLSLVA